MRIASLSASWMGRKPELSHAVGNCPVCDFLGKVFVASAFGFGSSGEKDVLFLWRGLGTNEFLGDFVEGFLRWGRAVVFLEGAEGKRPVARKGFVRCSCTFCFPSGFLGCGLLLEVNVCLE